MSHEGSTKGSNSHSESSNSSSSQAILILQGDPQDCSELTDLTLTGMPAPVITRTGTVRRASTSSKKDREPSITADDVEDIIIAAEKNNNQESKDQRERFRKSLDSTYRHSLESISEYKTKSSFSSTSLFPSVEYSSIDSSSSSCTDNAAKSTTSEPANKDEVKDKPAMSPSSSYLSWIESVNSEYFSSTTTSVPDVGADSKVGEWNNFWLNYNSARSKYLSSPYLSVSNEEKTGDELSDARSTTSTQKEFNEKNSSENVILTVDEINEAIKCCQRVVDILQNALRKSDQDVLEDSRNDSYYSQPVSQQNSVKEDVIVVQRERSYSYAVDQDLQKQRQLFKPAAQSSSSSCINALLNTGVADILKRVISKRRDILGSDNPPVLHRASFSDWSSTK